MKGFLIVFIFLVAALCPRICTPSDARPVVGLVERVRVFPGGLVLEAKMDTGADNSSLHTKAMKRFKRDGERWVAFELVASDGSTIALERELVRVAKIKRPGEESQKRPVVMLGICLGDRYREVQVTLVDRSRFRYPMIIGRSFLAQEALVDPSKKFTVEPTCSSPPKP